MDDSLSGRHVRRGAVIHAFAAIPTGPSPARDGCATPQLAVPEIGDAPLSRRPMRVYN